MHCLTTPEKKLVKGGVWDGSERLELFHEKEGGMTVSGNVLCIADVDLPFKFNPIME